ncbi:MAG: hypothetical protein WC716_08155 [Chitinophagaceae bacterium]|jgi:hypothetical protein
MTDNKRNIDEFFQEEFGNATEMPPSSVWETLEKRLDHQRPDSKKRFWWLYLLVLSMFIGGSIAAYLSNNKIKNTPKTLTPVKSSGTNNQHSISAETSSPNSIEENAGNNFGQNESENTADAKNLNETPTEDNTKNKSEKAGLSMPAKNTTSGNTQHKKRNNEGLSDADHISASGNSSNKILSNSDSDKPTENSTSANTGKRTGRNSGLNKSSQRNATGNTLNQNNNSDALSTEKASGNNSVNRVGNSTDNNQTSTKKSKTGNKPNTRSSNSGTQVNNSEENNLLNKTVITNSTKTNGDRSTSDKLSKPGKKTESNEVSSRIPKSAPENGAEKVLSSNNTLNKSNTKPPATTGNLKQESKPKKIIENKTEIRGLSGVPDDFEDDSKDEPSKIVDVYDNQSESKENDASEVLEPKASLENKIQKSRASNPLSGAPIAANVLSENDTKGNGDSKKESSESAGGGGATASPRDKTKRSLNMTIGIKAGYEQGFANYTSSRFVGSAFGEVNFSKKISFILQPGIKFGKTNKEYGSVLGSFIDAGTTTRNEYNIKKDTMGKPTGFSDFAFQQNYDSIVASVLAERRFVEIEVPFLFRFKVDNSFSILAGMNFTFGKIISSTSSVNRMSGFNLKDTIFNYNTTDSTKPAPSAPGIFSHTGTPAFSTYKDPGSSNPISPFRFGYSLGFSYTYKQRLMLDVMIQQNLSGLSNITDAEIKKIFSQPYVRLSLGCIIFGSKKP